MKKPSCRQERSRRSSPVARPILPGARVTGRAAAGSAPLRSFGPFARALAALRAAFGVAGSAQALVGAFRIHYASPTAEPPLCSER